MDINILSSWDGIRKSVYESTYEYFYVKQLGLFTEIVQSNNSVRSVMFVEQDIQK